LAAIAAAGTREKSQRAGRKSKGLVWRISRRGIEQHMVAVLASVDVYDCAALAIELWLGGYSEDLHLSANTQRQAVVSPEVNHNAVGGLDFSS
jgi:hypothetical protein